jgi:ribosomal protein L7/L12
VAGRILRSGSNVLLDYLRPYTRIADPVSLTQDFTHLQYIIREEQQKQLRDLAARGQLVTAIYIARRLYGSTLVEAKQMVEGLAEGERRS